MNKDETPFRTPVLTDGVPWSKDDPDRLYFKGPYVSRWLRIRRFLAKLWRKKTFVCAGCGDTFVIVPGWNAMEEAETVFSSDELTNSEMVCDGCWHVMRDDMPDLDARYQKRGL